MIRMQLFPLRIRIQGAKLLRIRIFYEAPMNGVVTKWLATLLLLMTLLMRTFLLFLASLWCCCPTCSFRLSAVVFFIAAVGIPWGPCRDMVLSFADVPAIAAVLIAFGVLALAKVLVAAASLLLLSLLLMMFPTFMVSLLLFASLLWVTSLLLMLFWRPWCSGCMCCCQPFCCCSSFCSQRPWSSCWGLILRSGVTALLLLTSLLF